MKASKQKYSLYIRNMKWLWNSLSQEVKEPQCLSHLKLGMGHGISV